MPPTVSVVSSHANPTQHPREPGASQSSVPLAHGGCAGVGGIGGTAGGDTLGGGCGGGGGPGLGGGGKPPMPPGGGNGGDLVGTAFTVVPPEKVLAARPPTSPLAGMSTSARTVRATKTDTKQHFWNAGVRHHAATPLRRCRGSCGSATASSATTKTGPVATTGSSVTSASAPVGSSAWCGCRRDASSRHPEKLNAISHSCSTIDA